jgi:uncharacterized protein YcbK (DUF882 family)
MTQIFDGTRRRFLKLGLATFACAAAVPAFTAPAFAAMPRTARVRALSFHNLHTDERLHVTYWKDGKYDRPAMARINHILRDHYSGDVCQMNPRLIDLLHDLQGRLHNDNPVEIISGYRSPQTNLMLARLSDGVAKNSFHTKGMAIDIRMQGTPLTKIHNVALGMRRGGVGYYPDSEFVHMDVGPVRRW